MNFALDSGPGSLSIKEVYKKGIFGILQESMRFYGLDEQEVARGDLAYVRDDLRVFSSASGSC